MFNQVILIGNLGRDPELRYTQSGTAVTTLNVATTRSAKNKDGKYENVTEWHNVVVWQQQAEYVCKYAPKGRQVHVVGRLQTRKWEKDGQAHYSTEIVADTVNLLGPKVNTSNSGGGSDADSVGGDSYVPESGKDDDIPF